MGMLLKFSTLVVAATAMERPVTLLELSQAYPESRLLREQAEQAQKFAEMPTDEDMNAKLQRQYEALLASAEESERWLANHTNVKFGPNPPLRPASAPVRLLPRKRQARQDSDLPGPPPLPTAQRQRSQSDPAAPRRAPQSPRSAKRAKDAEAYKRWQRSNQEKKLREERKPRPENTFAKYQRLATELAEQEAAKLKKQKEKASSLFGGLFGR